MDNGADTWVNWGGGGGTITSGVVVHVVIKGSHQLLHDNSRRYICKSETEIHCSATNSTRNVVNQFYWYIHWLPYPIYGDHLTCVVNNSHQRLFS